jgi:hypothetical protein
MSIWKKLFGGSSKPPTTATPRLQQASGGKSSPPTLPLAQPETAKSTLETEVLGAAINAYFLFE